MYTRILLTVFLCSLPLHAGLAIKDSIALRALLDSNGRKSIPIDSVATIRNDRIVGLDLSSKDIAEIFISDCTPHIGAFDSLKTLSVANNEIAALPAEIGNLTALSSLDAAYNELSRLPASMGNLTRLEKLDLRHNEFDEFPDQLLKMKNLWYLHLRGNELTTVPSNITMLSSLRELYLKNNNLQSLPESITTMELDYFEILDNRLCSLPASIDSWLKKKKPQYKDWQNCRSDNSQVNPSASGVRRR